jgi:drug/metabolite transporter (DMT)-like permease
MELKTRGVLLDEMGLFAGAAWTTALAALGLLVVNQAANVDCYTLFALSGRADRWRTFILLQILGGIFGLFTQLSYAGMVRYASLPFANATGIGLAFVSAQVFSAALLLREPFTLLQWAGTAFVFVGVLLIAAGQP